ncbi:MAG: aldo/keto reductase [Thermoguttaceae bacterium]
MSRITRREFLAGTAAAGAAAYAGGFGFAHEASAKITSGTDLVTLGKTGIKTSVLGIGTGTRGGREQRDLGQDSFTKLVRDAYDRGIRYIDTADMYKTHAMVAGAIKGLPRENLFIQTKTRAKDAAAAKADIERFRKELQLEQLDTVLMHCMQSGTFPVDMRPVQEVLLDAKAKGRIRAVGCSCHGWESLSASVDCKDLDVQLVRINPFEAKMDGEHDDVAAQIAKMHAKGRGIIGMKIYGESGYDSAEKRAEALNYVLGLGTVDAFTIGFKDIGQIEETLAMIEQSLAYVNSGGLLTV